MVLVASCGRRSGLGSLSLMIFKIIVWGCGEEFGGALVTQKDIPWNALAHGKRACFGFSCDSYQCHHHHHHCVCI